MNSPPQAVVDYVELAVADAQQARAFYTAAFGWQFQQWGPDYLSFHDGRRDAGGMRVEPTPAPPMIVLYSDDLEATRAAVLAAGGHIIGPDHDFPGGRRFHFRDPLGNVLAVWTKTAPFPSPPSP